MREVKARSALTMAYHVGCGIHGSGGTRVLGNSCFTAGFCPLGQHSAFLLTFLMSKRFSLLSALG